MRVLFIEARSRKGFDDSCLNEIKKIRGNIFLAYSIQYKKIAGVIRKKLSKKIIGFSQVLGCSRLKTSADAILLIGSGRFHGLQIALNNSKPVYVLEEGRLNKIDEKETEMFRKKRRAALIKFYSAEKVGIIVSTKLGQENMNKALRLRDELMNENKDARIFLAENIDLREFENFDIESWVNTACPGLELDASMVNYRDVEL